MVVCKLATDSTGTLGGFAFSPPCGKPLFNPRHVADCLDLEDVTVRRHIGEMNENQVVMLQNSDVQNLNIRQINTRGENFLTTSGLYKLIFKSTKPEAERFQNWLADEVLPSIEKNGFYATEKVAIDMFSDMDKYVLIIEDHLRLLKSYRENKKEQELMKRELELTYAEKEELKVKLDESSDWWTVTTFMAATKQGNKSNSELSSIGKALVKLSKEHGIKIKRALGLGGYRYVNAYHISIFKIKYPQYIKQIEDYRL